VITLWKANTLPGLCANWTEHVFPKLEDFILKSPKTACAYF